MSKQELTCIGKQNWPKLFGDNLLALKVLKAGFAEEYSKNG